MSSLRNFQPVRTKVKLDRWTSGKVVVSKNQSNISLTFDNNNKIIRMFQKYVSVSQKLFTSSCKSGTLQQVSTFLRASNCCSIVSRSCIFDTGSISKTESGTWLAEYKQNFEWAEASFVLSCEHACLSLLKEKCYKM